jgi:hypothetical protein
VQDRDQQDGDRPTEIERPRGTLEDRVRVPKVRLDVIGLASGLLVSSAWAWLSTTGS